MDPILLQCWHVTCRRSQVLSFSSKMATKCNYPKASQRDHLHRGLQHGLQTSSVRICDTSFSFTARHVSNVDVMKSKSGAAPCTLKVSVLSTSLITNSSLLEWTWGREYNDLRLQKRCVSCPLALYRPVFPRTLCPFHLVLFLYYYSAHHHS